MRTTLTLDDDLAAELKRLTHERGTSFKEIVNQLLRKAISGPVDDEPYVGPTFSSGVQPGVDLDHATSLVAHLEDREIIRKMEAGK